MGRRKRKVEMIETDMRMLEVRRLEWLMENLGGSKEGC